MVGIVPCKTVTFKKPTHAKTYDGEIRIRSAIGDNPKMPETGLSGAARYASISIASSSGICKGD